MCSSFIKGIFFTNCMAGGKKPTTNKQSGTKDSKKSKKDKGDSGPRKAEITVMVNENKQ